jgi:hypothetical protein
VEIKMLAKAVKPHFMGLGAFAAGALTGYLNNIKRNFSIDDKELRFAGNFVDLDKCLLDSYDVFIFSNKMSAFTQVSPFATEPMCDRAHVRPSACATEPMCDRAHVRPSPCATEPMCDRAHVRPSRPQGGFGGSPPDNPT